MTTPPPTEALHLCDVGSICAAIRHAELLSTTGTRWNHPLSSGIVALRRCPIGPST